MCKKFLGLLIILLISTSNVVLAQISVKSNIETEINNAIVQIYGEKYAPEIYAKVIKIAQKAISERPDELKTEDFNRKEDWYKDEIIYMFYVDQFGVVTPEKPNQFKEN